MRNDYTNHEVDVDAQKNRAFNGLRTDFSKAMLKRFHAIKGNIEDVWDLVTNAGALQSRLQTLAAKSTYTAKNLLDIALIACILWNNVEDEVEVPEE